MQAIVTKEFSGRPDSEPLARTVKVGEALDGDLAAVALREGWAELAEPEPALDGMTVEQLKAFASERQIDLGTATLKADIRAAIDAALAQ